MAHQCWLEWLTNKPISKSQMAIYYDQFLIDLDYVHNYKVSQMSSTICVF
jgi:hypothetical protein